MSLSSTTEPIFYYEDELSAGCDCQLSMEESRHLLSRRIKTDQNIILINGIGDYGLATISNPGSKREPTIVTLQQVESERMPNPKIHLATAIAKGDRQKVLLDMATQIGIRSYTPLHCERSVTGEGKTTHERWKRIMIEACKQSRQAWLPELNQVSSPIQFVEKSITRKKVVLFAHNRSEATQKLSAIADNKSIILLIGPEGGFSDQEVQQMVAAGANSIELGNTVLRIETAAIVALANIVSCKN